MNHTQLNNFIEQNLTDYSKLRNFDFGPDTTNLAFFDKILSGSIDIDEITMDLDIINGLGIDARTNLSELFVQDNMGANTINFSHSIIQRLRKDFN